MACKKTNHKSLWLFATFGILAGAAGIGALVLTGLSNQASEKVIDQSQLYIGVPQYNGDQAVTLTVTATSLNGTESKDYLSTDLKNLDGQDAGITFLNYASDPLLDLEGQSVGYWLADPNNSIVVTTTAKDVIVSGNVDIDKPGIWFVDVATEPGATPTAKHADYYTSKISGGNS